MRRRAEGIGGYQITERDESGAMVRASERALHFPVYPLLPLDEGEATIGFDLASSQPRFDAIQQAINTGAVTASGRVMLIQEQNAGEYGFLIFDPLYIGGNAVPVPELRLERLSGLVMGVFRISNIVEAVLGGLAPALVNLQILDLSAAPAEQLLYTHVPATVQASLSSGNFVQQFRPVDYSASFAIGGRTWQISVSPADAYMAGRQPSAAWMILGVGLVLALSLSIYLLLGIVHAARIRVAEERRELLENQLFRSHKLEAVGQLVGEIAHDFKNLLTNILGSAELLEMELGHEKQRIHQYIGYIIDASHRGNKLIQKLLSFSRNEPAHHGAQKLEPLVESALTMLRPVMPGGVTLHFEAERDLPKVNIDPTSFDQILVNLCVNARDAIKDQGSIRISLYRRKYPVCTCRSCDTPVGGEYVVLSLTDSGAGISQALQASIFTPFFTTKQPGKGTGLGLAIIHNIVHGCDGHIMLQSEPGRGTTFHILFPCEENAAAPELRMVV